MYVNLQSLFVYVKTVCSHDGIIVILLNKQQDLSSIKQRDLWHCMAEGRFREIERRGDGVIGRWGVGSRE